ncbi:unnamed protein product [Protopolystoma xenopodis]|uniref:Uncharacterized protein n=1 Tax=Protopolystoma xenopodis TaxID=117903 RepID=A0A448X876_9PLAT|nr:unnamed protein product [Protopolystoma xenopodis]
MWPQARGPQLARLDLYGNLLLVKSEIAPSKDIVVESLKSFLQAFDSKPVCPYDIAYLLPILLPHDEDRCKFVRDLVLTAKACVNTSTRGDAKIIYRCLCAFNIARANNILEPLVTITDLLHYTFYHSADSSLNTLTNKPSYLETLKKDNETKWPIEEKPMELMPQDGFLLLATSLLLDLLKRLLCKPFEI